MLIITHPSVINVRTIFAALVVAALMVLVSRPAMGNPASDRAFGNCVTAAAAYFETSGHQIGAVLLLSRDGQSHRLRITSAARPLDQTTILCTASQQTTAIEVISSRLAYDANPAPVR